MKNILHYKLLAIIKLIFSFLSCFILTLIAVGCISDNTFDLSTDKVNVGDPIPYFYIKCNDGTFFCSEQVKNEKCTLICFFNTQCPDCRKELDVLQNIYANKNYPVKIICISREEDEASIQQYWQINGITIPYSAQSDTNIYNLFALHTIPRLYIVNQEGVICAKYTDSPVPDSEELIKIISSMY